MRTIRATSIIAILFAAFALIMAVVCTIGTDRAEQCCDRNRAQVKDLRAKMNRVFDQGEKIIESEIENRVKHQAALDTVVAQLKKAQKDVERIKGEIDNIRERQAADRRQLYRAICPGGVCR